METIEYFHKGSCFFAAESERLSSDPMNLLVNASVGMWFADSKAMQTFLILSCIAFFVDFFIG